VVGSWNGSGQLGVGMFDPGSGTWYLHNGLGSGAPDAGVFSFGGAGWEPIVGDWSGTGTTGIGGFDPTSATWYLRSEPGAGRADAGIFPFGGAGWKPFAGNYALAAATPGIPPDVLQEIATANATDPGAPAVLLPPAPGSPGVAGAVGGADPTLAGNTLIIQNATVVKGATSTTIRQTAANTFTVFDGAANLGTFASVGSIVYVGTDANDAVNLDLNGLTYTGNFFADTGNGDDTVVIMSTGGAGAITGNVTLTTGAGNDTVNLNATGTTAVRFGGSVEVADVLGRNTLALGNAVATTIIGGDLSVVGFTTVTLGVPGATTSVGGSASFQMGLLGFPVALTAANGFSVGKDFSVQTGLGADTVTLDSITVFGLTQLNLGDGNDAASVNGTASFNGNFSLTEGGGNDSFTVSSAGVTFAGDLAISEGDGNEVLNLAPAGGLFTVAGNLRIQQGGGNNLTNLNASVAGDLRFDLGNGADSVTVGTAPAGLLSWLSGNGNDLLTLSPTVDGQTWFVNIRFGNGDDTLTLGGSGASQVLTGTVDGGGRQTANVFNPGMNWVLEQITLNNFP
jgi:hypothetical protein